MSIWIMNGVPRKFSFHSLLVNSMFLFYELFREKLRNVAAITIKILLDQARTSGTMASW